MKMHQRPAEFPEQVPREPEIHQESHRRADVRDHSSHGSQLEVLPARSISAQTSPRLRSRIATISSISSAVDTRGGPKAIQWGSNRHKRPWAKARRPTWTPKADRVGKPRLGRPVAHEFDRLEEPLAAHVADDRILGRQRLEAACAAARLARAHWPAGRARGSRAARRGRRRTRSGCLRRCAPRQTPGWWRSGPRRRRRSAAGRSSPTAVHSRR